MTQVITHTSRRINALAELSSIRNYLEIGVETGNTFFGVKALNKTAVDPRFLFDPCDHKAEGITFRSEPSDDFFMSYTGQKFDVVFIDGLHIFEQVFRDFTNTLCHCHDRSVIIVDDVFPSDVFSSFRSWDDTMNLRRRLATESGDWHGDVYKMIFLINDFFPMLTYVIIDDGLSNKQMAIWKKTRNIFSPIFDDFGKVYNATFFDLVKYEDCFPTKSEAEFLTCIEADLFATASSLQA